MRDKDFIFTLIFKYATYPCNTVVCVRKCLGDVIRCGRKRKEIGNPNGHDLTHLSCKTFGLHTVIIDILPRARQDMQLYIIFE